METFFLSIITPEGVAYQDDVISVTAPTGSGEITILPGHATLVSLLSSGELVIKKKDHEVPLVISRGALEVKADHSVSILTDFVERAEDIDIEVAEAGRKRAEEALTAKETIDLEQYAHLQGTLEKELARLRVGTKHKR